MYRDVHVLLANSFFAKQTASGESKQMNAYTHKLRKFVPCP